MITADGLTRLLQAARQALADRDRWASVDQLEAVIPLLAAAPDLYNALKQLIEAFDGDTECTEILDMIGSQSGPARAAIQKAEGR